MVNYTQTLLDLCNSYIPEGSAKVWTEYKYGQSCMHIQVKPGEIQVPTHWNLIKQSLSFHSHNKTFGTRLKNAIIYFFYFFYNHVSETA